jgi:hypothetical protein
MATQFLFVFGVENDVNLFVVVIMLNLDPVLLNTTA